MSFETPSSQPGPKREAPPRREKDADAVPSTEPKAGAKEPEGVSAVEAARDKVEASFAQVASEGGYEYQSPEEEAEAAKRMTPEERAAHAEYVKNIPPPPDEYEGDAKRPRRGFWRWLTGGK